MPDLTRREVFKKEKKSMMELKHKAKKVQENKALYSPETADDITNNNSTAKDDPANKLYPCELCDQILDSLFKHKEHVTMEHQEQLSELEKMFQDHSSESQNLLQNVPESEFILTMAGNNTFWSRVGNPFESL